MDLSGLLDGINPEDNKANQANANKGTNGTNRQYDQVQGNRGKQLNPNKNPVMPHKYEMCEDEEDIDGDVYGCDGSD